MGMENAGAPSKDTDGAMWTRGVGAGIGGGQGGHGGHGQLAVGGEASNKDVFIEIQIHNTICFKYLTKYSNHEQSHN